MVSEGYGGPWVAAAFLCERVIEGKDGVLSAIRIIDRFMFSVPSDVPSNVPIEPPMQATLVVALKAGSARGQAHIGMKLTKPSGLEEPKFQQSYPVLFESEDRGANLIINVQMPVAEQGVYWIDVALDGALVTRVPFRVIVTPAQGRHG